MNITRHVLSSPDGFLQTSYFPDLFSSYLPVLEITMNNGVLLISKDPTGVHKTKILKIYNFSIFMVLFKQTEAGIWFGKRCNFRESANIWKYLRAGLKFWTIHKIGEGRCGQRLADRIICLCKFNFPGWLSYERGGLNGFKMTEFKLWNSRNPACSCKVCQEPFWSIRWDRLCF